MRRRVWIHRPPLPLDVHNNIIMAMAAAASPDRKRSMIN